MVEVMEDDLIALLLKVEGNRPDSLGLCTQWHRNPEGPRAVAAITAAQSETAAMQARIAELEGALQWYASPHNWRTSTIYLCGHRGATAATKDGGNRARAALGSAKP